MFVLLETPLGFAFFKVLDERKLSTVEDWSKEFSSVDSARQVVKLTGFARFVNTPEASNMLINGGHSELLRQFLDSCYDMGETIAVADPELGKDLMKNENIFCVHNDTVMELIRGVRSQFMELIAGANAPRMSLGVKRGQKYFKGQFMRQIVHIYQPRASMGVEDILTIEAICYLIELDGALTTYAARLKTKYGRHFPELANIVIDNIPYAKAVKLMGRRSNAADLDFSQILPKEVEIELKKAAMTSTGIAISDVGLRNIKDVCDQISYVSEFGFQQFSIVERRMYTVAPNLSVLVGVIIGARLILCARSLFYLAKMPRNEIQFLGRNENHKYGFLYHAPLMRHVPPKHRFTILRMLAAKTLLAIRYDASGDGQDKSIGSQYLRQVKAHIRNLGRKKGAGAKIITAEMIVNSIKKMKHEIEEKKEHAEAVVESVAEKEEELEEAGEEAPINP